MEAVAASMYITVADEYNKREISIRRRPTTTKHYYYYPSHPSHTYSVCVYSSTCVCVTVPRFSTFYIYKARVNY